MITDKLTHPILRQKSAVVVEISDPSYCFYCNTPYNPASNIPCGACAFPQSESGEAQKKFITHKRVMLGDLEAMYEQVGKVRIGLWAAGALMLMNYLMMLMDSNWTVLLIASAFVALPYVALGFFAPKQPFVFALLGTVYFAIIALLSLFTGVLGIFAGLLWKAGALAALIYALKAGYDYDSFRSGLIRHSIDPKSKI